MKILKALYSVAPRRMVLVLNLSSSLTGRARDFSHAAASEFVSLASSRIPIALVVFSGSGIQSFSFQAEQTSIESELREVTQSPSAGKGHATIYDALVTANQLLQPPKAGDAIYLISNARDSSTKANQRIVGQALAAQQTRLYSLLVTGKGYPGDEGRTVTLGLMDLANGSGGFQFIATISDDSGADQEEWTPQVLQLRTAFLINLATGFYTLEIERPLDAKENRGIKVDVRTSSAEVQIVSPRLLACQGSPKL